MVNKKRIVAITLAILMLVMETLSLFSCSTNPDSNDPNPDQNDTTVQNVELTFDVDGEKYSSITTTGKETIQIPENPSKDGYAFDGWYWDKDVWNKPFTANSLLDAPISSDMSVYAKFTPITYSIKYELDGGTHNNPAAYTIETDLEFADAQKMGYDFKGWYTDASFTDKIQAISAGSTGDMTLYAKFELATYTITYENTKGAENTNPTEYTINSETITFAPLSKDGYIFDGWYVGETKVTEISTGSTGNLTLTAKWDTIGYDITYHNVDGLSNSNPETYDVEDQPLTLADVSKAGYKFLGWYTDAAFTNKVTEIAVGTIGDLDLYAKWEPIEYTATFKDGDTVVDTVKFTVETDTITAPAVPEHTGYTGAWESYTLGSEDITINAVYTLITYNIVYHNVDGANNTNPSNYDVEDHPLELLDASKDYYTFKGWYTDEALTNAVNEIAIGTTGIVNLYAKWEAIEYTATFKDGNTVVDTVKFTVETESITEPSVPTHTGYSGKWENYTLGHEDIAINAVYTLIDYNIVYHNVTGATNTNPSKYDVEDQPLALVDASKDYYTFKGWYADESLTTPVTEIAVGTTGLVNLYAKWEAIEYIITYLYDNAVGDYAEGTIVKTKYTVEDEFDFATLVCKNVGYTFNGWFTEKNIGTGTKVTGVTRGTTGNITVYAQFGLEEYDIIYNNVNGATNNNPTHYNTASEDFTIYPLTKEGYTFNGWFADEACTIPANLTIAKGSNGDITLWAKWTPITYTIEYVIYGGTATGNPATYIVTDSITFNNATLSGYVFKGWYTAAEGGDKVTGIAVGTTGNIVLYAHWDYISTIVFNSNGGSVVAPISNVEGTAISAPTAPTKEHYTFAGWYNDVALTKEYTFAKQPEEDITLYAKWTPVAYEIEYVLYGGINHTNNPHTYTVEDKFELFAPSKTGHTFIGWFTDAEFTSVVVTEIQAGTSGKIQLYAHYSINEYTIRFESNGGTRVAPITQNYATSVTAPEAPSKNGYTFAGWYSNATLTSKYTFSTMPAENITLYAKWTLETYNITYNLNGGTNNSKNPATYTITSAKITLEAPTKNGYSFAGWYTDAGCTTAITEIASGSYGVVEVFAKWTPTEYTITYIAADGTINNNITKYTIETDLTTLLGASLKGHVFGGWYTDDSYITAVTTIAGGEIGNKTVYAKFTANTYNVWLDGNEEAKATVSFNLNGAEGTIASQTVTPTATLKYPTVPTRDGYIFAGWYVNATCTGAPYDFTAVVTNDATLYAKWVKIENAALITINGNKNVILNGKTEQMLMFVPLVSGNVTITSSGSYDTVGTLYNSEMTVLAENDDNSSTNKNFHIVYNVTAGETYYIGTKAFSSTTMGTATVSISGDTTVSDGGYTVTTRKTQITYGTAFTLTVPTARDGYKFLGYADINGVIYTDKDGKSVKNWDKDEDTILYSVWERMVYTVTFDTNGGSELDSIQLAYGERFDISQYVTTKAGHVFVYWMLDGAEYNASTMPDHDLKLVANWVTYTVSIKYNTDKLAISVNDTISAELFDAYCYDNTTGKRLPVQVQCTVNGTVVAGGTISVRFTAEGCNKAPSITGIKVYGMPTLTFDSTVDYFNIKDGLTASHFGASGADSFGAATKINAYVSGEYVAGDRVKIVIESVDTAGNVTYGYIENVKAYGLPVITYNETKAEIRVNDTLNAALFSATAKDSFGEEVDVSVGVVSGFVNGDVYSYNTSTTKNYKYFTALNNETYTLHYKNGASGDRTYITVYCVTTGSTVKSASYYTNYSSYSTMTFSVKAGYEYYICTYAYSDSYTTNFSMYLTSASNKLGAGNTVTIRISATDSKGNVTNIDIPCKVYGVPTISSATKTDVRTDDIVTPEFLGITAKDTYNSPLAVTLTTKDGTQTAGTVWIVTATVTDAAGNVTTKDFELKVYGTPTITYDKDTIKATEDATTNKNILNVTAKDSFGKDLTFTVAVKEGTLTGGTNIVYIITAIDHLGNTYSIDTAPIGVYDANDIKFNHDNFAGRTSIIKLSSKGEEFDAQATDSFGNPCDITIEAAEGYTLEGGKTITLYIVATDKAGNRIASEAIEAIKVYDIPTITLNQSNRVISESTNVSFLFTVYDSFGEELYANVTVSGAQTAGNTVIITIIATDDAENTVTKQYTFGVLSSNKPFVELYVDGELWKVMFVDDAINYVLPIPEVEKGYVSLWITSDNTIYTDITGKGILKLPNSVQLHIFRHKEGYTPIFTVEQLKAVTGNQNGKYELIFDLDLGGIAWTPIGTYSDPFTGTFDGNGHVISNFKVSNYKVTGDTKYAGLFGRNKGTIENLGVENFTVDVSSSSGSTFAGGLVGANNGIIKNCYVAGNVTTTSSFRFAYAGGLTGCNDYDGTITNCYATGSVTATSIAERAYAGGLVGHLNADGAITNCYATSNVSAAYKGTSSSYDAYVGGLVGHKHYQGTIINCYRYNGQTFTVQKGSSTSTTATNTEGTEKNMITLQSVTFQTKTLTWSADDWNFVEGQHPTLKNVGTTN